MQKPTRNNKQLLNDIEELFLCLKEASFSKEIFTQVIINFLLETYRLYIYLEEKTILKSDVTKFEKDLSNIDSFIEKYKQLFEKALENDDKNLQWRYEIIFGTFEIFKSNPNKAICILRNSQATNILIQDTEFFEGYLRFLKKHDTKEYESALKIYHNQDLFFDLYAFFEGYRISQQKLFKSTALKIFNYCYLVAKVKKGHLAQKIEFIFATLGETISLDAKRAYDVQAIGEYKGMILLDYASNKQGDFTDFGLADAVIITLRQYIKYLKKQKQKDKITQINTNVKLIETAFIAKLLS